MQAMRKKQHQDFYKMNPRVSPDEFDRGLDLTLNHFDNPRKGYLTKEDIARIIAAAYRNQNSAEKVAIKDTLIDEVYRVFDRDHSGSVDYGEFGRILKERYFRK